MTGPNQPGSWSPDEPQYPQPGGAGYPPPAPSQYPEPAPGQYPPPGGSPSPPPRQYPPAGRSPYRQPEPGQYPPAGASPYPQSEPGQYPPPEPGQYPPPAPGQYPPPGGYPAGAYGTAEWGQPPAPSRRRRTWIWALVAVVVIAAGVLTGVLLTQGNSTKTAGDAANTTGRTLSLPSAVDDYKQIAIDPRQLMNQFGSQLSGLGGADLINKAKIGIYGTASSPRLVFIGFQVKDVPRLQDQIDSGGVDKAVQQFVSGITSGVGSAGGKVTSSARSVDPGPLGGTMQCGEVEMMGQRLGACAWGDRSAFALNLLLNPTDPATTAKLVRDMRAAAEHK